MKLLFENWRQYLVENQEEPDLIAFSEDLNDRITSLLFNPKAIEELSTRPTGTSSTAVLDTGELFANYDTVNEVHMGVVVNDKEPPTGKIDAFYLCVPEERSQSNLVITLSIPRNYDTVEGFRYWLTVELEDALSHELEHSCDLSPEMSSGDIPEGEAKWESLENIYKHYGSGVETRGHVAGAMGRSRRTGVPAEDYIDGKMGLIVDEAIERGYKEEDLKPIIEDIWRKWRTELEDRKELIRRVRT